MDPRRSVEDVVRCDVCDTPVPPLHCDFCQTNLCKACVGDHLLDFSHKHQVIPFQNRGSTIIYHNCSEHVEENCRHYCEQCDIPVCVYCTVTGNHKSHNVVDLFSIAQRMKIQFAKDLNELEKSLFPIYKEIAINITVQKTNLYQNFQKLTAAINKHGEEMHRQVDIMIHKLKSDLDKIDSKYLAVFKEQEDETTRALSQITLSIAYLKKLLDSNDASLVSAYKSRNAEFRSFPPKLTVALPNFTPRKINTQELYKQFGSLSTFSIKTWIHNVNLKSWNVSSETTAF